jgi:hypothetical protein
MATKTINISITDRELKKLGIESTNLSFSELVDIIRREIAKERLNESVKLAEKHGLSSMTMNEISQEVKAAREDAENDGRY